MDAMRLTTIINASNGRAAKRLGSLTTHYRAAGLSDPLSAPPVQQLCATFTANTSYQVPERFGKATWIGTFDATDVRAGDFLVSPVEGTFFVAVMPGLLPVLCVRTERIISVLRTTSAQEHAGLQDYGGTTQAIEKVMLSGWPASILMGARGEKSPLSLPSEVRIPWFTVLMADFDGLLIRSGDFLIDDLGRRFIAGGTELTHMGWRITAMLAMV